MSGGDGSRLWSVTKYQGPSALHSTAHNTQPVVADVDNDGNAELVMAQGNIDFAGSCNPNDATQCVTQGLYVYEGASDDWMPTRPMFNQQAYRITNILNDGTIPAYESPHWLQPGLNRARVNVPLLTYQSQRRRFYLQEQRRRVRFERGDGHAGGFPQRQRAADTVSARHEGNGRFRLQLPSAGNGRGLR